MSLTDTATPTGNWGAPLIPESRTNEYPEPPNKGFVNITIEVFLPDELTGVRTNIARESLTVSGFLGSCEHDIYTVFQRLTAATRKEILTPSVKTDMA